MSPVEISNWELTYAHPTLPCKLEVAIVFVFHYSTVSKLKAK